MDLPITAVLDIPVVCGFINRGELACNRGELACNRGELACNRGIIYIYRLLEVSVTAVNLLVTAVLDISVIRGFINRGELIYNRGIIYIGCWRFHKPR